MKTLYININSEPISSSDELAVMDYDLTSDFFFYLGERIGKGCKIQNENALITDFNTPENKQDYDLILSQWNEVKRLLFSDEVSGSYNFELPSGYLHWLRYNEQYNHVYEANFSNGGSRSVMIDLKELYEDSVEYMQRKIMRLLQKEDITIIVFNDDVVTCKSLIVESIHNTYKSIDILSVYTWQEKKRLEKEIENQKRLETERVEREKNEQLEREQREKERLEKERLEKQKRLSSEFLSYKEFYIFCDVYPKIYYHSYNNNEEERRFLLLKLREQLSQILDGKSFCINRYSSDTFENPNSPFFKGNAPLLYYTHKDFQIMSFFEKLCELSKHYGVDWQLDESILFEIYNITIKYRYSDSDRIEIKIPYLESRNDDMTKKKKRTTLWSIHDSTYTFIRILKW